MDLLRNAVRPYAWGSRTVIAELLGNEVPTDHPEAELWLGAHPGDPSMVLTDDGSPRSLLDVLAEDPVGQLGQDCARKWGNRLPFLLKVLAAEEPLSMQAHPSAKQAEEGYAKEEAAEIPRDATNRNYPDPTAKPELICALSEFHALAGFRNPHKTVEFLRALDISELAGHIELLAGQPDSDGLRALFTTWVTMPQTQLDTAIPALLESCVAHLKGHGEFAVECRTILELGESYPTDAGVLAALLLNRIVLSPGEAIYLPAGNLHAYLRGTGIEIMANSDNILRCGFTPKHVDVPELLRVLDFSAGDMPISRGELTGHRVRVYRTDAEEFELSTVHWAPGEVTEVPLAHPGPQIVLCTHGSVDLRADSGRRVMLRRGESAWLSATDGKVIASSQPPDGATLFRATAGALRDV